MYKGVNGTDEFTKMLYTVSGILITVIAIGSILVIYNSFAISVSERKKQFGMLSSVGATKKQIKKAVIYEGAILGIIGIPLGIISGVGGMGVTLKIVNNLLQPLFNDNLLNWELKLVISWEAIIIAIFLITITIYLSVIIPARRASKISPIEAIRQNDDIKIKSKKLRIPKFMKKLFKIEGEIALKNLKRSKKRYRTTVISLIISIVLFISVSGFIEYMYEGFDTLYATVDYDYSILIYGEKDEQRKEEIKNKIKNLPSIEKLSIQNGMYTYTKVTQDRISKKMLQAKDNKELSLMFKNIYDETQNKYNIEVRVIALEEETLQQYKKEVGVSELKDNQAILINYVDMLRTAKIEGNLTNHQEKEKINILKENKEIPIEIIKVTDKMPFAIKNQNVPGLIIIISQEQMQQLLKEEDQEIITTVYMTAKDDKILEEELKKLEENYTDIYFQNIKEEMQQQQNLKLIIQIFLYGFITLISLIGISNIFNTISTNIALRRREFAMLKSIGMTDKSFKKMLNLECIFYGTKSLLYGIPLGSAICYFINQGFANMIEFVYQLPWKSIIISVISVYIIVFITMIYSSRKIKKENIIDVLRNENA
ncbi:MAG: FtsX-like permease family protein [Clostridia bacterium]|jgi:putative ABC transport system permease protein|nr:FtsX-like permease family protein [Clostridia bacterium]